VAELDDVSLEGNMLDQLEQDVLDSARDDVPPPAGREQLLAALSLAPSSGMTGRASPRGGAGARVAQVMGVALAVGAVAVVVSMYGSGDASAPAPAPSPSPAVVAPVDPVATTETPATVAQPAAVPSPQPSSDTPRPASEAIDVPAPNRPVPALRAVRTAPSAATAASPAESTLGRELARVTAARSALAGGEAARTLHELDAYDAEFPAGAFSVEVAVLRIEALARSGRGDEARRLGDRFLAQHPQGLFARRVATTLRSVGLAPEDPLTPIR